MGEQRHIDKTDTTLGKFFDYYSAELNKAYSEKSKWRANELFTEKMHHKVSKTDLKNKIEKGKNQQKSSYIRSALVSFQTKEKDFRFSDLLSDHDFVPDPVIYKVSPIKTL